MTRSLILTFVILFSVHVSKANADIVINVDTSDLSAVTFTTTAAFASDSFLASSNDGIVLSDFFEGNTATVSQDIGSTISAFDSPDAITRLALDWIWVNNSGGGFTINDLAFFQGNDNNDMYSFNDQRALTGSAVFDLSAFSGLPDFGMSGDIYFGNPNQNQVIGQWQVVPEPSSAILIVAGSLVVASRRRRR